MELYPHEASVINFWAPVAVISLAVIVCLVLLRIAAPYGRYESKSWGFIVPARPAWVIQETPSFLAVAWFLYGAATHKSFVNAFFISIFAVHYFYRSYVYPFTMVKSNRGFPLFPFAAALGWCLYNGYAVGRYFGEFGPVYPMSYMSEPQFVLGVALWMLGFGINIHSDYTLSHLRKPGETGYKIPFGGAFNYVSGANFFGEIVEWTGFAIASGAPVAWAFAIFTACNIGPRAIEHHRWYLRTFGEKYPKRRKALIPFVL